jgi:hypothetical protein
MWLNSQTSLNKLKNQKIQLESIEIHLFLMHRIICLKFHRAGPINTRKSPQIHSTRIQSSFVSHRFKSNKLKILNILKYFPNQISSKKDLSRIQKEWLECRWHNHSLICFPKNKNRLGKMRFAKLQRHKISSKSNPNLFKSNQFPSKCQESQKE